MRDRGQKADRLYKEDKSIELSWGIILQAKLVGSSRRRLLPNSYQMTSLFVSLMTKVMRWRRSKSKSESFQHPPKLEMTWSGEVVWPFKETEKRWDSGKKNRRSSTKLTVCKPNSSFATKSNWINLRRLALIRLGGLYQMNLDAYSNPNGEKRFCKKKSRNF